MAKQDVQNVVLHVARLARGLTLLTDGTAYDLAAAVYLNPSDWSDRQLVEFRLIDHMRIEQVERHDDNGVWFHTIGLVKFDLGEIETYRPMGLSEQPVIETLTEIAEALTLTRKAPKVGENIEVKSMSQTVRVVRHRTDQLYGMQVNLREVVWD